MATILFPSPIFGPIHSRRLGVSLGINLLPADGKVCSFDCIYCECGLNMDNRPNMRLPSRTIVHDLLEEKLAGMAAKGKAPDAITFAGNGEPTGHPEFPQIVDDVLELRDRYAPNAQVCVLTNATHITKPNVFNALLRLDNPLLKLDTVDVDYIKFVDRPQNHYDLNALIDKMTAFRGKCSVQTMFLKGTWEGRSVDNTSDAYVLPWIEVLKKIKPMLVTIYTIDRDTPSDELEKATKDELDSIADRVRAAGLNCSVSY